MGRWQSPCRKLFLLARVVWVRQEGAARSKRPGVGFQILITRTAGDKALGRNGKVGDNVLKGDPRYSSWCPCSLCSQDLLIPHCPIWAGAVGGKGSVMGAEHYCEKDGLFISLKLFFAV